jgi:glycosidase
MKTVSGKEPTELWRNFFSQDVLYAGGPESAKQLPTFLGNHDAGRLAMFLRRMLPQATPDELLARVKLGHVLMMTARGVPTIYSGDEQGFVGKGGDQDSRQPLFASKAATYNEDKLLGTTRTNAVENFDTGHPLYKLIAELAAIRKNAPALRRGATVIRGTEDGPGLLAFSRLLGTDEYVILLNTSNKPIDRNVQVDVATKALHAISGQCPNSPQAPGSIRISLPPLGYAICHAAR